MVQRSEPASLVTSRRRTKSGVLIADDDVQIRRLLSRYLLNEGFEVWAAENGEEALYLASLHQPNLIVLDLSMPVMDGFEALKRLREWYRSPVIILSAADQEREKVRALDLGADDYMTKPFGPAELAARVRASLRRADRLSAAGQSDTAVVEFGEVQVDLGARLVKRAGTEVHLTRTEYDLLRMLVTNPGKVLTHRQLLQGVWGPEYGEETEYLRTFIKQLRRKLEGDPSRPAHIITEPGVGYRFTE